MVGTVFAKSARAVKALGLSLIAMSSIAVPKVVEAKDSQHSEISKQSELRAQGNLVGAVTIPALGISSNVYSGVDTGTLRKGVGYWPGTGTPGKSGNAVLAGHRTAAHKPFNRLPSIKIGDQIKVYFQGGMHTYQVFSMSYVPPTALWIKGGKSFRILGNAIPTMTLFTCNNGSQERFAVFAFKLNNYIPPPPPVPIYVPRPGTKPPSGHVPLD